MGTVETRAKTLAGSSGPVTQSAKPQVPGQKPPKQSAGGSASSGSGREGTIENGVRVSFDGKDVLDGDLGGVVEIVKNRETKVSVGKGFGGRDFDASSEEEDELEDSEMRGVSSLLKMKGSLRQIEVKDAGNGVEEKPNLGGKLGSEENGSSSSENGGDLDGRIDAIEVPIEDMSENKEREGEEGTMSDERYEFSVGDFVWGKIRSHPWWPGQVYDPLDASEYAAKLKIRNRLLVAYFGDGTFAWCQPSQLKPFEENFEEMSRQSNSKSFVYAVQQAVDEIGRLLELHMASSCLTKENEDALDRPLAVNAGIKDGVRVPEGRIGELSNILLEPVDLLADLKLTAQTISICSELGLRVLKSQLAAFYRAKGVCRLPTYHEPQTILGLEDPLNDEVVHVRNTVEIPIQGPFAEDWLSSPVSSKLGQNRQTVLHKCLGNSEERLRQRRKQKSIAEIMEGNNDAQAKSKDGDVAKEGANSGKLVPSSRRKKRKGINETDGLAANDVTSATGTSRKATTWVSPLSTDSKVPSFENDGSLGEEGTRKSLSLRRRKKREDVSSIVDGGRGKELSNDELVPTKRELYSGAVESSGGEAKRQVEKGSLSRERKKSKYLSPPFTNLIRGQPKADIETESLKVSNEARLGERMTRAAGHLAVSPPIQKCNGNTLQKNLSEELGLGHEPSKNLRPQAAKEDQVPIIDPSKVKVSAKEVLFETRRAAVNPSDPTENKRLEMFGDFLSILRSSVYCDGSNYNEYNKHQTGRKRKNLDSKPGSLGKDQDNTTPKSPGQESKQRKSKQNKEAESHEAKPKRTAEKPGPRKKPKEATLETKAQRSAEKPDGKLDNVKGAAGTRVNDDGKASPAVLLVTFGVRSSLPSKADLLRIYSKFGTLNEAETDLSCNDFCARVAFVRSSDAEEAFNHSVHTSPFKAANVTFRLEYPSTALKTRELREIPPPKASPLPSVHAKAPEKPSGPQQSQLDFLRQKLEMVSSMLENSDGEVSVGLKHKLERAIKCLLESVSAMVGSSS